MASRSSVSTTSTNPGMTEVVTVRVSSASGSSTSSVRFWSAARTTMAPSSTYLTRRKRVRHAWPELPRGAETQPAEQRAERADPAAPHAAESERQGERDERERERREPGAGREHGGQPRQRVEAEEEVGVRLRRQPLQAGEEEVDEEEEARGLHGAPDPAGGLPAAGAPARSRRRSRHLGFTPCLACSLRGALRRTPDRSPRASPRTRSEGTTRRAARSGGRSLLARHDPPQPGSLPACSTHAANCASSNGSSS